MAQDPSDRDIDFPSQSWTGKVPRAQWVYEVLREAVRTGRFRSGERIREEAIAGTLGVSRTPVRDALSRLLSRGLLELGSGGLVVAKLDRTQVLELYAMREALEGSAARFAARNASPGEVSGLQHLATRFADSIGDPATLAACNRDLHEAIYEAAHNRYLMRMLDELNDALALLQETTLAIAGRAEASVEEHGQVIAAIAGHDGDEAEIRARRHIRRAQEARLELISRSR